jgi:hypothetical protein
MHADSNARVVAAMAKVPPRVMVPYLATVWRSVQQFPLKIGANVLRWYLLVDVSGQPAIKIGAIAIGRPLAIPETAGGIPETNG